MANYDDLIDLVCDYYTESNFISRDDIFHNMDRWKRAVDKNVLLITGLSGGGKTTTGYSLAYEYNAELFQLDWIDNPHEMKNSPDTPNYGLWQYVKKIHKDKLDMSDRLSGDEWHTLVLSVFNTILEFARINPKKLFIVEGVQIPGHLHDYPGIEEFPIIIKGTSVQKSVYRRFKRDGIKDAFRTGDKNIIKYYLDMEKKMNMFRGQILHAE